MSTTPMRSVRAFPSDERSVAEARRFVRGELEAWGAPDLVDSAALATSELVTNAVLHAGTAVRVSARAEAGCISVAVGDEDPQHAPRRDDGGLMAPSGRGIHLVELLASSWGVEVRESSKVVWFEAAYPVGGRSFSPARS